MTSPFLNASSNEYIASYSNEYIASYSNEYIASYSNARTGDKREGSGDRRANLQKVQKEMSIWLKIESQEKLGELADDYVLARKSEVTHPGKPSLSGQKQDSKQGQGRDREERYRRRWTWTCTTCSRGDRQYQK